MVDVVPAAVPAAWHFDSIYPSIPTNAAEIHAYACIYMLIQTCRQPAGILHVLHVYMHVLHVSTHFKTCTQHSTQIHAYTHIYMHIHAIQSDVFACIS
jgi:hypothetical protein